VDAITADLERPDSRAVVTRSVLGAVSADELLARQLFGNLIGNAVKYVAPGVSPRVRIESRPRHDMLEIRVSDNGVGIPPSDRARVFDSFFRAGDTTTVAGSGLGLAICRRAVERHGGWIVAREGPGGTGTTIVFTLPLVSPGRDGPQPGADQTSSADASGDAITGPEPDRA
jgi:signal transduction histidine kinase